MEKIYNIELESYRAKDPKTNRVSKVFTGRDKGKLVREQSKIDEVVDNYDKINIIIPQDIYSINPSFFEEFLVNVVTKLGKEDFLKKFHFESLGDYEYELPLYQAVDRILKTQNALEK